MRVTVASLRRHIGPEFELPSLENHLSANAGRIDTSSAEQITWSLGGATESG